MLLQQSAALPSRITCGLNRWDLAGIIAGGLSLALSALISTRRDPYFWYDEVATASLVSDPSLTHMLRAIAQGAENNPPLYPLLLRAWSTLFGTGAPALRSLSALAFVAAFAVTWLTLRRGYPTRAAAMGVAAVFFGAPTILEQLAQARFYGLFLLAASVALALAVITLDRPTKAVGLAIANGLAHLFLVYTHTFGTFFSGALLTGMVALGLRRRELRWWLYGAIVVAWLLFALWAPLLFGGARVMTGRSWIPLPQRDDLIRLLTRQALWLPFIAAAAVALAVARMREEIRTFDTFDQTDRGWALDRTRETIVVLGLAMIGVVFAIFAISRLAIPIFLDRYLLPAGLGWTAVVAHVVANVGRDRLAWAPPWRGARVAYAMLYCALALFPIAHARAQPVTSRPGLVLAAEYETLPVVAEAGHDFFPLRHYAGRDAHRFRFLLDLPVATDPANKAGAAQEHHLMVIYRQAGYLGRSVEDARPFLCTTPRFLIVDRPEFLFFERRVASDSGVVTRSVATYDGAPVRLVERRQPCPGFR